MATARVLIERDLYDSASASGLRTGRTTSAQLAHWARLGQQLDASPAVSAEAISRALRGEIPYDELGELEQIYVRAEWDVRIAERLASLDFRAELETSGRPWVEGDDTGNAIVHPLPPEPRRTAD